MIFLLIVTVAFAALLESWGREEDRTRKTKDTDL